MFPETGKREESELATILTQWRESPDAAEGSGKKRLTSGWRTEAQSGRCGVEVVGKSIRTPSTTGSMPRETPHRRRNGRMPGFGWRQFLRSGVILQNERRSITPRFICSGVEKWKTRSSEVIWKDRVFLYPADRSPREGIRGRSNESSHRARMPEEHRRSPVRRTRRRSGS